MYEAFQFEESCLKQLERAVEVAGKICSVRHTTRNRQSKHNRTVGILWGHHFELQGPLLFAWDAAMQGNNFATHLEEEEEREDNFAAD